MGEGRGEEKRREEGTGGDGKGEERTFNKNNALAIYKSNKSQSSLIRVARTLGYKRSLKVIGRFFLISLD